MKKYFIDCGGHNGESVVKAMADWGDELTAIHTFEPNPAMWHFYKKLPTILHKKAVWIYDGEIDFYISEHSLSSGIHKDRVKRIHSTPIDIKEKIRVSCIDFSQWIFKNFNPDDYIILKMNVEGAEYAIFDKMFKDGSIKFIKEMWGDLHRRQFPHMNKQDELNVIDKLASAGLPFHTWSLHDRKYKKATV